MRTNQDIGDEREGERVRRESESKGLGLETAVDSITVKLLLSEFKNRAWQGFLTYRRFSSRATGRAKTKIILSVSPAFSLFVRCRLLAEETSVKWERIALFFFSLWPPIPPFRSLDTSVDYKFNDVAHILLLSFVLPYLPLPLHFHNGEIPLVSSA